MGFPREFPGTMRQKWELCFPIDNHHFGESGNFREISYGSSNYQRQITMTKQQKHLSDGFSINKIRKCSCSCIYVAVSIAVYVDVAVDADVYVYVYVYVDVDVDTYVDGDGDKDGDKDLFFYRYGNMKSMFLMNC